MDLTSRVGRLAALAEMDVDRLEIEADRERRAATSWQRPPSALPAAPTPAPRPMSAVEISALARQVATDAAAASLRTMSEAIGEVVAGERAARRKELEEALAAERQRTSTEIAELHRQLAALKRKVAALQKQVVDVDKPKPLRLASG